MYEVKIELPGKAPQFVRGLKREQASERVMQACEAFMAEHGGDFTVIEMQEDGPLIVGLRNKNKEQVGKVSAYEQPLGTRQIIGKSKELKRQLKQLLSAQNIADQVVGVVDEIMAGKWPETDLLTPFYTVADIKNTKGFWVSDLIIAELAAGYVGRFARKLAGMCGLNPSNQQTLEILIPILAVTNQVEIDARPMIRKALNEKYGTEHNPDEIEALEAKLIGNKL